MNRIERVSAEIHEVPLRHPFATAKDKLDRQVSRLVRIDLTLDDGRTAVGEAVPVAYVTGETPESVVDVVRQLSPLLEGTELNRFGATLALLRNAYPSAHSALAGVEMAVYEGYTLSAGISLYHLLGGAREEVETDVTISIVADAADRAREAAEAGFRCFKIKIGGDLKQDLARLAAIYEAAPSGRFRVDANQAYDAKSALRFINEALDSGVPLELVEQPTPKEDLAALDAVAALSPVPIFADEAVITPADALRVVRETRAQGINVKLMKSSISGSLDIIAIARAAGLKLMIGCMLETRLGISSSLAVACGTGAFDYVDLDSHLLLNQAGENSYFVEDGPFMRPIH